ncbi:NUMOD1 domain-containing DNA-binding protein [Bacillus paramycoides]|uniref:NUMOD1 domain-containing DNA-binding protein n=1 Tax=Bacillus paramycoides TaxID=2026194 RepID=A0ABU6MR58_9BACI|nr:NUMOD1 domain-containing DNA-binding protein [Bacillus paramycoides]
MTNKKKHPLYLTWKNMKDRCYCKTSGNYKYYGAKGVTVAERWHNFDNFVYDIDNYIPNGHLLYNRDYQLDKDKHGGKIYSLENCTVISTEENRKIAYQKQQKRIVAMNENEEIKFQSISEASRNLNIPRNTIQHYLKNGKRHPTGYQFKYCC